MNPTTILWNTFSDSVFRYFLSRVSDSCDAEDLRQEVFLKIHLNSDSLRESQNPAAWVFTIAKNTLTDYYRKNSRRLSGSEAVESLVSDPERDDFSQEFNDCLLPMLDTLPDPYRDAMKLHFLEGKKQQEVADLLGISLSGAKSRIQRGREILKDNLIECCNFHRTEDGTLGGIAEGRENCVKCDRP